MHTSHPIGLCVCTMAGCGDSVTPFSQDVVNPLFSTYPSAMGG